MPAPARSEELARKQRDARSKKLLLLLVPVMIGLVVFQGPRLMKQFDKAKETTEDVQGQVVQGFEELSPNGVPAETALPGAVTDPAIAALATAEGIPDTDVPLEASESDLVSFTRFDARDPFAQLVDDVTEEDAASDVAESSTESSTDANSTDSTSSGSDAYDSGSYDSGYDDTTGDTGSSDSGETASQVTIAVNGDVIVVRVGDVFPVADPAFKVVAIEGNVVKVGLASGSFSNGVDTLDLEVGESVTLISQPDGARFTIKITSLG